jgi:hypothetical protein
VWSGVDGGGTVLATAILPLTNTSGATDPTGEFSPFVYYELLITGVAKSMKFDNTVTKAYFDNIGLTLVADVDPIFF